MIVGYANAHMRPDRIEDVASMVGQVARLVHEGIMDVVDALVGVAVVAIDNTDVFAASHVANCLAINA